MSTLVSSSITSGEEVTIKCVKTKHSQLEYESKVYETLTDVGVPFVRWFPQPPTKILSCPP
jgi:hypothetical protein